MESKIANLMKSLEISRDEALELIAEDQEIDRMKPSEVDSDLTQEQKQAVKKMKNAGVRKPTVYKHDTRPRKEDTDKRRLIASLADFINEIDCGEPAVVTNPERQIDFDFHGRKMRLVLSAPRK